ncbi:unnamed protein product [Calicophoron daubneyi]|uniref:Uncharacterized protein n=1 Tax=Calicophoron daubneyi TaxID=300641 RepID=A0AAV2TGU4_CALDB
MKRAEKTAARTQCPKQSLIDLQYRRSSYPEIITSATGSQQPPVREVEDRDDVVYQQTTSGAGAISTSDLANVLRCWYQESLPTSCQLRNLLHRLQKFLPNLPQEYWMLPQLHSALISPVAGLSTAPAVKYPVMRLNSVPASDPSGLNLSIPKTNATPQSSFLHDKDYGEAILGALQSTNEVVKNVLDRVKHLDLRVAVMNGRMNKYHRDVLRKVGNQSPTQPRRNPWFPLRTITDLNIMEHNLQYESCRAKVVAYVQTTPAGSIQNRIKCCLSRTVSDDLSRHLSRQRTHNRYPFETTSLWALICEILAASDTDREKRAVANRHACAAWFQNARKRSGGRSKRRYTCPEVPLVIMTPIKFMYCFLV